MNDTKILSQKIVFKSKFFHIKQVEVELSNGKTITKDIIERFPAVLILAITDDDEIYLVEQYRDALQSNTLELVAGVLESDSSPLEAAKRELQEEAGITANKWIDLATMNLSSNMVQKNYIFVAKDLTEGEQNLDPDENITVRKMTIDEVIEKVMSGAINNASQVSAILFFDKMRKEGKI